MISPTLAFGLVLSVIDTVAFSLIKKVSLAQVPYWMTGLAVLLYAMTPLVFLQSMKYTSLSVMNLTWDLLSDVMVTLVGLFFFKEILTERETIGVLLGIIAIILFSTGH